MGNNGCLFSCDKGIVMNALYDALDELSFVIDDSNSLRGTLLVSSATFPEMRGRVEISPVLSGKQTLVEIFADGGDENPSEWNNALMDEVQSLIKRAGMR